MKKLSALLLCVILGTISLFSMNWPVQPGIIEKNFGWNEDGQPVLGVIFEATGQVLAADNGELLFYNNSSTNASGLPSPLGSWIALDHGAGIVGIYSRMAEGQNHEVSNFSERNNTIGSSGMSGWTERTGVYFSLFDRRERRWINPAIIINPAPVSRPMIIQSVMLRSASGEMIDLSQARNINQGRYSILTRVSETPFAAGRTPLAPFRIICTVNGLETGRLNFESYTARDGVLMAHGNNLIPARQAFASDPYYELGSINFARGQVVLEIITHNVSGGTRNAVFRFTVE